MNTSASAPARIHHVALTVTDLDASVAWYERVLSFKAVPLRQVPPRRAGAQLPQDCVDHLAVIRRSRAQLTQEASCAD
jgi:catechol 2,3-dioxygenase-like lactoylglutathione lyase family enzyme